jgi:hypothetical protein
VAATNYILSYQALKSVVLLEMRQAKSTHHHHDADGGVSTLEQRIDKRSQQKGGEGGDNAQLTTGTHSCLY